MIRNIRQLVFIILLTAGFAGCDEKENTVMNETHTQVNQPKTENLQKATFAGGCFWGVEHNFRQVPGVIETAVGFMGGNASNPSYRQVCDTETNHAEVVHLSFDPEKISYEKLVRIFFLLHDPTTLNRQGPDVGTQYRSAIFYHDDMQKQIAEAVKAELTAKGVFSDPIVTEITVADRFWLAEDYHQQYIEKNPTRACHLVDFKQIQAIIDSE